ncbi:MAG: hypothetical protein ACKVT0_15735 [Planctomycetaceae bacterium]
MSSIEITLVISDQLAREATANGLLTPESVEELLRAELRRRRVDHLFESADRLSSVDSPMLSEAEIESEIRVAREQRRSTNASDR